MMLVTPWSTGKCRVYCASMAAAFCTGKFHAHVAQQSQLTGALVRDASENCSHSN